MTITTVHAVHFSPTGTVEKTVCRIARNLAKSLGAAYQEFSYAIPANREKELSFTDHDLVVWGSPTYAGRVPNLLLPYLTGKVQGNGALAVPVVLFGNRNFDDSLMELHHILRDDGFTCIAAGAFVGEHAFSTTLGAGRPDAADEKEMDIFSSLIAEKLLSEDYCETIPAGNDPIAPYFTPRDRHGNPINILKVKPKTDPALCDGCGLCVQKCPMGSIEESDPTVVSGVCIKCCACVKCCPHGAKYYDDAGYLYHKQELEEVYTDRARNAIFVWLMA